MDRNSPTVSVIITTYNRAHLLGRAVESVLKQTYHDFEIIIVDDCSSDDTKEIVRGFKDHRLRYIRHEQNRGNAISRNSGIYSARGKYIAFIDDDDEWLPNKLKLQVNRMEESPEDVALIYTGSRRIADNREIGTRLPEMRGYVLEGMLTGNCLDNASTLLVRNSVFRIVGFFDENRLRGVDSDLIRRISREYKVDFVDEILVNIYVDSPNRMTPVDNIDENKKCIREIQHILNGFSEEFKRYPRAEAERYLQMARHAQTIYAMTKDSYYRKQANRFIRKSLFLHFNSEMLSLFLATAVPALSRYQLSPVRICVALLRMLKLKIAKS